MVKNNVTFVGHVCFFYSIQTFMIISRQNSCEVCGALHSPAWSVETWRQSVYSGCASAGTCSRTLLFCLFLCK